MSGRYIWICAAAAVMAGVATAQSFNSGSTGSDGALNFTTPGTVSFDPAALGLDPSGDNIFNFTTINIAAGVTVNLTASKLRNKSVVWLASGAVTIAGTLNLSGANGYAAGATADQRLPPQPGPGGYPGGVGATDSSPAEPGAGPGGALPGNPGNSNASYGTQAPCSRSTVYGNSLLVPLRGGSGGAGSLGVFGGGGGAGGGAIQIVSSASITISGSILANGGSPLDGNAGSGSGGAIHLEAPHITGGGSIQAVGGIFPGVGCGAGAGSGWITVDTTNNAFTGTISPSPTFGPLYNVPLPSVVPMVTVTTINGVNVPSVPTGSFSSPDVTINNGNAVTVAISASNVPVGTVVSLYISSQTGADQVVQASPLAGTVANSTATASIVWPLGVSRVFIRAVW